MSLVVLGENVSGKLQKLILACDFENSKKILSSYNGNERRGVLIDIAWTTENLAVYGFVEYLLRDKEDPFWHSVAAQMMLVPLCHVEGAYSLGLCHIRKAALLEPDNIEHKEFMLAFHDLPEPLLTKQEAISIAQEVLAVDPASEKAIQILSDYGIISE